MTITYSKTKEIENFGLDPIPLSVNNSVFGNFLRNLLLKVSDLGMMVEGSKSHPLSMISYPGKA